MKILQSKMNISRLGKRLEQCSLRVDDDATVSVSVLCCANQKAVIVLVWVVLREW